MNTDNATSGEKPEVPDLVPESGGEDQQMRVGSSPETIPVWQQIVRTVCGSVVVLITLWNLATVGVGLKTARYGITPEPGAMPITAEPDPTAQRAAEESLQNYLARNNLALLYQGSFRRDGNDYSAFVIVMDAVFLRLGE